jgi:hypothetical protein
MATIINAQRSTIVGTLGQIRAFLAAMTAGAGVSIVNLGQSNFIILAKPITDAQLWTALKTTPEP